MRWTVEFMDERVQAALYNLPLDMRASFERIAHLLEDHGIAGMREPYVKHLQGPLWEMRLKGRSGIARAAYVTVHERRVVVVHVFVKKTQKTPPKDLAIALRKAREIK